MGSSNRYNALAQEKTGDFWVNGFLFGAQDAHTTEKEHLHVVVALVASGSMGGQVLGGQKMNIDKDAVTRFVNTLPERARVGLVVYGHKGSNSKSQK
jgi:hypothetical protein